MDLPDLCDPCDRSIFIATVSCAGDLAGNFKGLGTAISLVAKGTVCVTQAGRKSRC